MLELGGRRDVFGDASTPAQALTSIGQEHWDIVVLDISLGGASGLELLGAIQQLRPRLPVLVLSMHSEEQYARRAFQAGASAFLLKSELIETLIQTIYQVVDVPIRE